MEQTRQKHNRLLAENQRLTASVAETDKNLKATQEIYDALTATDSTKTKELESLEQKLKELQDKSDEEKYTIYKRQLEENIASLQKLQSDCEEIKAQDAQLLVDINQLQNKRSELLERKQTHETGKKAAETLLQQLGSLDTEAYRQEVVQVAHQLAVLETVYGKLCVSFAMINKTLGGSPFEQELPLNDQIKKNLTTLKSCATEMRTSLIQCANSLKMEEK
jgi:chromosome segregation ATPase